MKRHLYGVLSEPVRLLRPFWKLAGFATAVGVLSGFASAGLIATINRSLHAPGDQIIGLLMASAGLCLVAVAGELIGNLGNSLVGQDVVARLRTELSQKIVDAPLAEIERYKTYRLLAALDRDVSTIAVFTFNFSQLAIAFAVTVGSFVYLAILSPPMFFIALAVGVVDIAAQLWASRVASGSFDVARNAHDDLQKHYRAIIDGAKELRVNRPRRTRLMRDQLGPTIMAIRDRFVSAIRIFYVGRSVNSLLFFLILLTIIAAASHIGGEPTVLSGFVLVLLFVRGPIEQIVGSLPLLGDARVSLRRVAEMSTAFTSERDVSSAGRAVSSFAGSTIELRDARYAFPSVEGQKAFVLGPIDLAIKRGELVLITGKNGSGKTTLIKLLLGLYSPTSGALMCDGQQVDTGQLDDYRQLFSAIFFDYFLFDDLVADAAADSAAIRRHLERLEIADKVSIRDNAFSTTDLSTGQRKRLALIHVLLEQRPIVVLDEWAADQDPAYRRVFYEELLPELQRSGKTLIVVSHDDRYVGVGDRVLKMADGLIVDEIVRDRSKMF